jgi:hypothetical protein
VRRSGSVEDLALLSFEFGVAEHSRIPEFAELFELGQLVVRARGGRSFLVLGLRWGLFSGGLLLLRGPPSLLAVLDASSDGGSGSGDHSGAGDST